MTVLYFYGTQKSIFFIHNSQTPDPASIPHFTLYFLKLYLNTVLMFILTFFK